MVLLKIKYYCITLLCANLKVLCTPTIIEPPEFYPNLDAEDLYNALKAYPLDEETIREILPSRTCSQRQQIQEAYKEIYEEYLSDLIECELSGAYKTIVQCCFFCNEELLAVFFNKALLNRSPGMVELENNIGETTRPLVLSTESDEIKKKFHDTYLDRYGYSVDTEIEYLQEGDYLNVCREIQVRSRQQTEAEGSPSALEYAQRLSDSVDNWENDRQLLDEVLMQLPLVKIREIMKEYVENIDRKQELYETIAKTKHLEGEKRVVYKSLAMFVKEPLDYYADVLYNSVDGSGTDEDAMTFIILYRCEKDLVEIDKHFSTRHGGAILRSELDGDISGAFKNLLLSFLPLNDEEKKKKDELMRKRIENQKARLSQLPP